MVVESKVADAFILLIIIADVREAGKSGDAVLEIGTTHTRFTKSKLIFPEASIYPIRPCRNLTNEKYI